ncbi:non-homologous end joining protein Ku [Vallitalea okinawensis]|uniref:non-homologous end joining protein Ku n=1 Tax=Vallitalea okinawensis TaxID=2078660 RepID=UPI000CFE1096|nr:Ku protein [Vallitalea okinawensis]
MHTMWKGSISFGLVNIPIKMFAATEDKDIRFRYLHKKCHTPIKYKKVCETCDEQVTENDIVKGFEYEPGHFVIITDEDFEAAKTQVQSRTIDIIDFVNLKEIDPIYFHKSYYLSPQETGGKAYSLLRKAMGDTGKIAIAKITIRNKQTLAALRVYNNILVLESIFYPDEVREVSLVPGLPESNDVAEKELDIATQLIDNLTTEFDPSKYTDDYRIALRNIIEQKISGQEVQVAPEIPQKNVIDLMEALQASIKETEKEKKTTKKKEVAKKKKTTTKKKTSAS